MQSQARRFQSGTNRFSWRTTDLCSARGSGIPAELVSQSKPCHVGNPLERWARRKFKSLSGRRYASVQWLQKLKNAEPQLFYHWSVIGNEAG